MISKTQYHKIGELGNREKTIESVGCESHCGVDGR